MTVLGDVFGGLRSMSQLQLLLAFGACIGYAFAQGRLLASTGKRVAWAVATLAAAGFAFESDDWTHAVVLFGFAIAGLGSFVAMVWLTSRALGVDRPGDIAPEARSDFDPSTAEALGARTRQASPTPTPPPTSPARFV